MSTVLTILSFIVAGALAGGICGSVWVLWQKEQLASSAENAINKIPPSEGNKSVPLPDVPRDSVQHERDENVQHQWTKLSPEQRRVLKLVRMNGKMSPKQIGERLGTEMRSSNAAVDDLLNNTTLLTRDGAAGYVYLNEALKDSIERVIDANSPPPSDHPSTAQHRQMTGQIKEQGLFTTGTNLRGDIGLNLALLISIQNADTQPSIAQEFRLDIRNANAGIDIKGLQPEVHPAGLTMADRDNPSIDISFKEGFLYQKTLTPIPPGGIVCGWLLFLLPLDTPRQSIRPNAASYTLWFQDVVNGNHSIKYEAGSKAERLKKVPDLQCGDQPFNPNTKLK